MTKANDVIIEMAGDDILLCNRAGKDGVAVIECGYILTNRQPHLIEVHGR